MKGRSCPLSLRLADRGPSPCLHAEVRTWTDDTANTRPKRSTCPTPKGRSHYAESDGQRSAAPVETTEPGRPAIRAGTCAEARAKEKAEREQAEKDGKETADDDPSRRSRRGRRRAGDEPSPTNRPTAAADEPKKSRIAQRDRRQTDLEDGRAGRRAGRRRIRRRTRRQRPRGNPCARLRPPIHVRAAPRSTQQHP